MNKYVIASIAMFSSVLAVSVYGCSRSNKPGLVEQKLPAAVVTAAPVTPVPVSVPVSWKPEECNASDIWYIKVDETGSTPKILSAGFPDPNASDTVNRNAFIQLLKKWSLECRETAYTKAWSSCDNLIVGMVSNTLTYSQKLVLNKKINADIQDCKQREAESAKEEAALAKQYAKEDAEREKRNAEEARERAQKQAYCSIRNIQITCCDRACNGSQSIGSCLRGFYRKCDTLDETSTLSCSCL